MAVQPTISYNRFLPTLLSIKVVKGNELTDLITETFDAGDFAESLYPAIDLGATASAVSTEIASEHGLARSRNVDLAVRVSKQIAVLGARGDYVDFLVAGAEDGVYTAAMGLGAISVQALDYSGVPVAVQHSIFGKYSPFLTPTQPVSKGMIRGVDRQEIELTNNVVLAADDTFVEQQIRGTATERLQWKADVYLTPTLYTLRAKPLGDGVFVIPRGARIWAGTGKLSERVTTNSAS